MAIPIPQQSSLVTDITVAEVIAAQMGRSGKLGPARIKDTKGRVWNIWTDKLEQVDVAIGRSYAAMYTSGTYTNPHTGVSRPDNTIVGLNPLGTSMATDAVKDVPQVRPALIDALDEKSEDIALNGLFHSQPLAELAVQGDAATIVKALRTMRLAWREYKKQAVIAPSGGGDFDDEIPY